MARRPATHQPAAATADDDMSRWVAGAKTQQPANAPAPVAKREKIPVPHDPTNEIAVLAAGIGDLTLVRKLAGRLPPDTFIVGTNADAWAALVDLARRGLDYDPAVVRKLFGDRVADHLAGVAAARGSIAIRNLDWHVSTMLWDRARASAAIGSVPAFLDALQDPTSEPEKLIGHLRTALATLQGHGSTNLLAPGVAPRGAMRDIESRLGENAVRPLGLDGLDWFEDGHDASLCGASGRWCGGRRHRRMLLGSNPGWLTWVTARSGNGKSALLSNMALGIIGWDPVERRFLDDYRRVCWGVWEPTAESSSELLAALTMGWNLTHLREPRSAPSDSPVRDPALRREFERRMHQIDERVRWFRNPFWRQSDKKPSNDRNLDMIHAELATSGCHVFVADLWAYCLASNKPEDVGLALRRQHAMLDELQVHGMFAHQQLIKGDATQKSPEPSAEGMKGAGDFFEVGDSIVAPYRPHLYDPARPDDKMHLLILKQRHGKWPLRIECNWDPEYGRIWGGRTIAPRRAGEASEGDPMMEWLDGESGRRR